MTYEETKKKTNKKRITECGRMGMQKHNNRHESISFRLHLQSILICMWRQTGVYQFDLIFLTKTAFG